jgi:hypothetical protein
MGHTEPPMEHSEFEYVSGDDFVVEFLDYRYAFSRTDFEQRVTAAAVRLELVPVRDLGPNEAADLVELASAGRIDHPRSRLGRHLAAHSGLLDTLHPDTLAYWLRKLVFRGAWLDHQVKRGALEVVWDETEAEFAYQHPGGGGRPLLELAPVPSWHELQFKQP